ncbi:hypothetical protein I4I73_05990 [Pseudonocardia sp. KRD-184]|uniref:Uncharacterized protein n=1 Tax=Pseudonocardia oceani TaxID=2792013 RepID=A0ABS6U888_9PSEU|nr:DUF6153 family protein [Pseudonocardia oceani]MBW0088671.1 hypothetical protein [Pseudonocardia oceani]MBW0095548.1 hypothetical protein [Pseudonocardia oceani]MBW0108214.1 hypothetical protein [Pseudonocardia oceani]MBW0120649.1 hypothetical protein [Pseudonocardia oceani]MBW0128417.1 hypothetical protein [Pseudonocardia oceani]
MHSRAGTPRVSGWLLALAVAGLVLGLIGMHHVLLTGTTPQVAVVEPVSVMTEPAGSEPGHGSAAGAPVSDRHADHLADLLHLCLAVLFGALVVVIALFLLRGGGDGPSHIVGMTWSSAGGSRAPPPTVPRRLALLCVLRT